MFTRKKIAAAITATFVMLMVGALMPAVSPITASVPVVSSLMPSSARAEVSRSTAIESGRSYCQRHIRVQARCFYDRDYLTTYHRVIDYYYYITPRYGCYMRVYVYRTNGYAAQHRNMECFYNSSPV